MKYLDRRISPWFLPLLFVVVLLCINWIGEIVSRDGYSYQVAGLFRQTALICFLMGLVLGAVGRRPRLCITPVYWVILLPYLLFVLFYLFPEQFPWSALISHRQCRFSLAAAFFCRGLFASPRVAGLPHLFRPFGFG